MAIQRSSWWVVLTITSLIALCSCSNDSGSYENPEIKKLSGKEIFTQNCSSCHGMTGDLGSGGAKDLTVSELSRDEIRDVIVNGTDLMPPYGKLIEDSMSRERLIDFVNTLIE